MRKYLISLGLILALLPFGPIPAMAAAPVVQSSELVPTAEHRRATKLITRFITNYHYKRTPLDDRLSEAILERYLQSLDPNRSYFLAGDVDAFNVHRHQFDNYLRDAQLEPAFQIFRFYRERMNERTAHAIELLTQGFDFTVDETFELDRSEAAWPANRAELDEIWRKRVKNDFLSLRLAGQDDESIRTTLRQRYEGMARRTNQLKGDDVYQIFINAYTASVEPHTAYLSPRNSENFEINMSLSLEGIGAVLQTDNDHTVVLRVVPGGPADRNGKLQPEDRIVGVGEGEDGDLVDVIGWRLDDVVDLIRGPKDSVVRIQILPKRTGLEGPPETITLVRNKITLEEQAAKSSVIEIGEGDRTSRLGVIQIPSFYLDFAGKARGETDYRSTTRDVRRLINVLKEEGIDGLVVDLRGNGGGSLTEVTELTGLFIEGGPVVQVRDSTGRIELNEDTDPSVAYEGPLAVLVDRHSASASEIFAGAIQDYQRGVIIGEPTFGKGTVQNLVDLGRFDSEGEGGLGQLKTTIAQFFRINGASTQSRGVVPDIIYPTAINIDETGERSLDNALPWDSVEPLRFRTQGAPVEQFDLARQRHEQRIQADSAFQLLLEETEHIHRTQRNTTVTLLEDRRRAEREALEQEQKDRQERLRAAQGLPPLAAKDDEEAEATEPPDVLLTEAANILKDLIVPHAALDIQTTRKELPADGVAVR